MEINYQGIQVPGCKIFIMFKTPAVKVDAFYLNDEKILLENEKTSILKISLIETSCKSLKISKFFEGSLFGSVSIPLNLISKPNICSTEIEFLVQGPIDFKELKFEKIGVLKDFKIKASYDSGFDSDIKAFSSFFEYCCPSKVKENAMEPIKTTSRFSPRLHETYKDIEADNFIRRIPKVKKNSPLKNTFVHITAKESPNIEELNILNLDLTARPVRNDDLEEKKSKDKNDRNPIFRFDLKKLTADQESCFLSSEQVLYGME